MTEAQLRANTLKAVQAVMDGEAKDVGVCLKSRDASLRKNWCAAGSYPPAFDALDLYHYSLPEDLPPKQPKTRPMTFSELADLVLMGAWFARVKRTSQTAMMAKALRSPSTIEWAGSNYDSSEFCECFVRVVAVKDGEFVTEALEVVE